VKEPEAGIHNYRSRNKRQEHTIYNTPTTSNIFQTSKMSVGHMMIVGLVLLVLASGIVYVLMLVIPINMANKLFMHA
jgi:hypothetical protein